MDNCLFSAIVPVYNVENCLGKCVDSLLSQRGMEEGLEVLLIDDGSRDESGRLCDRYAETDPRVRVFHKQNGGLSSARNVGIENARGEYVFFVDSDDFIESDSCQIFRETIRKYANADAVVFDGTEDYEEDTVSMRRIPSDSVYAAEGRQYLLRCYRARNLNVEACLYAYRREFLNENALRFQEGILHEDVEFTPRALLLAKQVVEIPDRLYHYVIRENSISTSKDKEKNIRDLFSTLRKQCEIAEQQEGELGKWMKNSALNSYLNMVYDARMYQPRYRKLMDKRFLRGKAATPWNHFRVMLCMMNVRLYCYVNDSFKAIKRWRRKAES